MPTGVLRKAVLAALGASMGCSFLIDTTGLGGPAIAAGGEGGANAEGGTTEEAGDGGAPDASGDGAGLGGASCPAAAFFCDGFDDPSSLERWELGNVTARITSGEKHRGPASLELELVDPGTNGVATYSGKPTLPEHLFARVMVRFEDQGGGFLYFGRDDYADATHLYVGGDGRFHLAKYNGGSDFLDEQVASMRWYCVELEVDQPGGIARAWFDSDPTELPLTGIEQPYELLQLVLGAPAMRRAWFDELALGSERLGCPP